ncbi:hypothetical protein IPL85_01840 [Candidatus Saccharibacteria bacterium]|nr:MAG: hypothetical protein IPL85_01840 [Candidatus Saccharibacteria bacterium]
MLTGSLLAPGDADYLMQSVEAARKSMLEYGQFPWWNPWISGGVPLFANPQFGLLSLPTLCGLVFGSILGYKIALVMYLIIGFWGMFYLLNRCFRTPIITAILLSYVWTFGSFFAHRVAGHYTFFTIEFFPLLLYIFIRRREIKHGWLWFGLLLGLMINAAAHNTTVMSLAVIGLFIIIELVKIGLKISKKRSLKVSIELNLIEIKMLVMAGLVTLVVAGPRMLLSMSYVREYPRNLSFFPEETIGIFKGIFSIFGPIRQYIDQPTIPNWSWMEVSAYIGFATGIAAIICLILLIRSRLLFKHVVNRISPGIILILGVVFFLLGLGLIIGNVSPYNILSHLPVFSDMRVASRWMVWSSLMVILFVGAYPLNRYRKVINALVAISVVELFIFGSVFFAKPYTIHAADYPESDVINQQIHYDTKRNGAVYDENLTATTMSNIGQVIAGDALIDTRNPAPFGADTIRCDSDINSCTFILTNNATVEKWSPNHIILRRTGPGNIRINMNPGKYWLVNGVYPFWNMRLAEPGSEFIITNPSDRIALKIQPKFSPEWFMWRLSQL